jgi:hypothetical protein
LKSWQLDRRVGDLSEKLKPVQSDIVTLDFDSFSEPEKQLFRKIWEIQNKYGLSPPADVLEANKELIFKALEVYSWRVMQLFMFVMEGSLSKDEVEVWYFKLHFYNFFEDLKECLANVRNWSEKDREEFLRDMKQNGIMNKVFRIPRGFNERNTREPKKNKKKAQVNDRT